MGFWYDYSFSKGGLLNDGTQVPSEGGWAIGIGHLKQEWAGGFNRVSFQYGTGNAANFSTSIFEPTVHLPNAKTFRFTDSAVIQPNNHFAMQPIFIYRVANRPAIPPTALTPGCHLARGRFGFSPTTSRWRLRRGSTARRAGWVFTEGWLRKYTIAPQIGAGRKFFSRPVLRAFLTYANWSDGLKGYVGVPVFTNKTSGWDFGLQGETWW